MARKLVVEIVGDTRSLQRSLRLAERQAQSFGSRMSSLGSSLLRGGIFAGAIAGAGGLAVALKAGFDEMKNAQQVTAQTNAAIKSTGGIAGVTAKQVDELANSMLKKTGIDDEATKTAENMLLTFTNVRNVVGKNNDVFNQATTAVADMATRMAGGAVPSAEQMQATALRLGKALQDPIRGMGALKRVGVEFTDQQEKQIKTAVASGHTLEAQKIILRELQTEFGGSAKAAGDTFAGSIAKLTETAKNLAGTLAEILVPTIQDVADSLTDWLADPENQKALQDFTKDVVTLTAKFGKLAGAVVNAGVAIHNWATGLRGDLEPVNAALNKFFRRHHLGFLAEGPEGLPPKEKPLPKPRGGVDFRTAPLAAAATAKAVADMKKARAAAAKLVQLRNQWFDAMIGRREDRVQDIRSLQGQIAEYRAIEKLIQDRINVTKDITRRLHLEDELAHFRRARRGVEQEIAENARQRAAAAKEAARQQAAAARALRLDRLGFAVERAAVTKTIRDDIAALRAQNAELKKQMREQGATLAARRQVFQNNQEILRLQREDAEQKREAAKTAAEAAAAARTARQFRQLGLGPTGEALIPLGRTLLKRVGRIQDAIRGTVLDTREHRRMLTNIRRTLVDGLGQLAPEVRQKIQELLDALNPEKAARKPKRDPWRNFGLGQVLPSGLTGPGLPAGAALPAVWSRMMRDPRLLPGPLKPATVTINGGLHLHGIQDVGQFENELLKRAGQRPQTRRGPV